MVLGGGDRPRFIVTLLGARPVGGLVAIRFGTRVAVPWASTLRITSYNVCYTKLLRAPADPTRARDARLATPTTRAWSRKFQGGGAGQAVPVRSAQ